MNPKLGKSRAEELKLEVLDPRGRADYAHCIAVYRADDIHRLLGAAVEILGSSGNNERWAKGSWPYPQAPDTRAYAVGIREIQPESELDKALKLLKELIAAQEFSRLNITYIPEDWAERARALLAGKSCEHKRTVIWEPHLAGARKCQDCGMVYGPGRTPQWQSS